MARQKNKRAQGCPLGPVLSRVGNLLLYFIARNFALHVVKFHVLFRASSNNLGLATKSAGGGGNSLHGDVPAEWRLSGSSILRGCCIGDSSSCAPNLS